MSKDAQKLLRALAVERPAPPAARFRNGIGAFYRPCVKLTFFYESPRHGLGHHRSLAMSEFIRAQAVPLARRYTDVEVCVTARRGPPAVQADYGDGGRRTVDVTNMKVEQISDQVALLRDGSAFPPTTFHQPVIPDPHAESVVPLWDPFHARSTFKI